VSRERAFWLFVVAALLVGGWLVARGCGGEAEGAAERLEGGFREWFWTHRALDLAAQVGLILAGALGVAAILPDARREGEDQCDRR